MNDLKGRLIGVHNVVTNIYVHGDDAIRMAGVLTELRAIVTELNETNASAQECKEQEMV